MGLGVDHELRRAAAIGRLLDLRTGANGLDDPSTGARWGEPRTVPANLLYELLVIESSRAVVVRGARISGGLNLESATLGCPLILEGCYFDAAINLRHARAETICLGGCHLNILDATALQTSGEVNLSRTTAAVIGLQGARIGGQLTLSDVSLTGGNWPPDLTDATLRPFDTLPTSDERFDSLALMAEFLTVDAGMYCSQGFDAKGGVRLTGAQIHGPLTFAGASVTNERGSALAADGLTVAGSMLCEGGFAATGGVRLIGAQVHGQLSFDGARLANGQARSGRGGTNEQERALLADGLIVGGSMLCQNGFAAIGEIRLDGAQIRRQLAFHDATLANPDGHALSLYNAHVDGSLWLRFAAKPEGAIFLEGATVGTLYDSEATWASKLYLRGLTYNHLEAEPEASVKARLRWLRRQAYRYAPQPYEQLAAFYRRAGREDAARAVAITKQRRRRGTLGPLGRVTSLILGGTVGHGYRAWMAGGGVLTFWGIGAALCRLAYPEYFKAAKPAAHIPGFDPLLYSLDLVLPIVNLHQRESWIAMGPAQLGALLTVLGWLLSTAAIAALTGILKRD